ncbi:hypothetical protein [Enterococcus faecium]|uniref:hypothetical protein n=1 Tax=Enterococcus faecium TaxID=1352 RepID=UPI0023B2F8B0|nr:hypothetical protein [Enterococcus faecium]
MLKLSLVDAQNQVIASHQQKEEVYLAFKTREYSLGEKIILETDQEEIYVWVQVDEALAPSLIFLKGRYWEFPVILEEDLRRAYSPKLFSGKRHYLRAYLPREDEWKAYRNLALNAHDQKEESGAYPHAFANVETRNDSTFFARNAIDGMIANEGHGSFPYQSWGINQQADAEITIDFGRDVLVDKLALVLRGDYPHDSYWTSITVAFSDGTELIFEPTNALERQFFTFPKKTTQTVTLKHLLKHEDESSFPALTEIEVYGIVEK